MAAGPPLCQQSGSPSRAAPSTRSTQDMRRHQRVGCPNVRIGELYDIFLHRTGTLLKVKRERTARRVFSARSSYGIVDYVDQAKTLKGATSANC
jgi:hypothetical protein